jgi:copper chaperone
MTATIYRVTGMTCEHCARAVSAELRALDGVSDVAVELVPGGASAVTVTSEAPLAAAAVAAALDEAGAYRLAGRVEASRRDALNPLRSG